MIRIAIDIDGVLFDQLGTFKRIAEKYKITEPFDQEYNGIWKVKDEMGVPLGHRIFVDNREEFLTTCEPLDDAVEGYNLLTEQYNCYIVTSRNENTKELTIKNLETYFDLSKVDDILFTKDKTEAPCNVLVDDYQKYVKQYMDARRMGVLMNKPYNSKVRDSFPYNTNNLIELNNLLESL